MFSTFVGLGRFINCQRPDVSVTALICQSSFALDLSYLFIHN